MSPITALVNTNPAMAPIQAFPENLQIITMPQEESPTPFASFFNAALGVINDTNLIVGEFEQAQLDFATGRLDDILAVQMAQDRANNAINFTSQITSRIIESYREIMRMQI
ncbi:MAG: flagellar hook-basal body complex protein FliE [Defluviitaleaceae bacterium]|nr:flagellar hook-basal body complex protein FliE [Defluviitaleaceae bacterium]